MVLANGEAFNLSSSVFMCVMEFEVGLASPLVARSRGSLIWNKISILILNYKLVSGLGVQNQVEPLHFSSLGLTSHGKPNCVSTSVVERGK